MGSSGNMVNPETSGVRAPFDFWCPEIELPSRPVQHPASQDFLDFCTGVKPADQLAERVHFTPESLRPWLGNIMILEPNGDMSDFRYRLYGSAIVQRAHFDMTGRWLSEVASGTGMPFIKQYADAIDAATIVVSLNRFAVSKVAGEWERVVCPVIDGDRPQIVATNYFLEYAALC